MTTMIPKDLFENWLLRLTSGEIDGSDAGEVMDEYVACHFTDYSDWTEAVDDIVRIEGRTRRTMNILGNMVTDATEWAS